MEVADGFSQLDHERQAVFLHHRVLDVNQVAQTQPIDEFHDQELLAFARRSPFVRLDDVRVPEGDGDFAFARLMELRGETGFEAPGLVFVEHLEGHDSARKRVAGAPHARHASLADPADQLEAPRNVGPGEPLFAPEEAPWKRRR